MAVNEADLSAELRAKLSLISLPYQREPLIGAVDGVNALFYIQGDYEAVSLYFNDSRLVAGSDYVFDFADPQHVRLNFVTKPADSVSCFRFRGLCPESLLLNGAAGSDYVIGDGVALPETLPYFKEQPGAVINLQRVDPDWLHGVAGGANLTDTKYSSSQTVVTYDADMDRAHCLNVHYVSGNLVIYWGYYGADNAYIPVIEGEVAGLNRVAYSELTMLLLPLRVSPDSDAYQMFLVVAQYHSNYNGHVVYLVSESKPDFVIEVPARGATCNLAYDNNTRSLLVRFPTGMGNLYGDGTFVETFPDVSLFANFYYKSPPQGGIFGLKGSGFENGAFPDAGYNIPYPDNCNYPSVYFSSHWNIDNFQSNEYQQPYLWWENGALSLKWLRFTPTAHQDAVSNLTLKDGISVTPYFANNVDLEFGDLKLIVPYDMDVVGDADVFRTLDFTPILLTQDKVVTRCTVATRVNGINEIHQFFNLYQQ